MVQWTSEITAVFDHPIEHVWDFVSDVRNQDHWVVDMSDSSLVGGGELGLGAQVVGSVGGKERVTATITLFEPPERVAWHAPDANIAYRTEITLTPQGGGTHFHYAVTITSRNALQALIFGPLLRPLANLKARSMLSREIDHLRAALAAHTIKA